MLQSNFSALSRTIGSLFIPIITKVLPYLNALVIAVQRVFSWVGKLFGINLSDYTASTGSAAIDMDAIIQLGKGGLTPENTKAVDEALAARELIKISVLQNCLEDPKEMAQVLAERTHSQVVQVIGKKIVLYREGKKEKKKIELPK